MSARQLATIALGATLAGALASDAGAQALRVQVLDATTGTGIAGALVAALDANGRVVAEGLSSPDGTRTLRLPAAGRYRLRVRRIGMRPFTGTALAVEGVATREVTLEIPATRQALAPVRVTADAVCGRTPEGDSRLAELFDQFATALEATRLSLADSAQAVQLQARQFERELATDLSVVASRTTRTTTGAGRIFVARDAAALAKDGFVVQEPDRGYRFFAPDEAVLASDDFVRTHCFSAPPADSLDEGYAELRFRPAPGRRRPDIAGTAYIDTLTGEPRRITYRYVFPRALLPVAAPHAGGEVQLERLVDGSWFVPRWSIRMPLFGETDRGTRVIVAGWLEVGGEAAPTDVARSRLGTALPTLRGVTVLATVLDEGGQPVVDAAVSVDSARGTARTDSVGVARLLLPDTGAVTVCVRRIGVTPADSAVRFDAPGVASMTLRVRRVQPLATVTVTARTTLEQVGYVQRKRLGFGWFMDSTEIRRRNSLDGLTMLSAFRGIEIIRVPTDVAPPTDDPEFRYQWVPGQLIPVMRASAITPQGARICLPLLLVNARLATPAELQALVGDDIAAIEVYLRPTQVPAEYRRPKLYDICGAVLVWTTRQR